MGVYDLEELERYRRRVQIHAREYYRANAKEGVVFYDCGKLGIIRVYLDVEQRPIEEWIPSIKFRPLPPSVAKKAGLPDAILSGKVQN